MGTGERDEFEEELRVARVRKGTSRSRSRATEGYDRDLTRDRETGDLTGPTESRPATREGLAPTDARISVRDYTTTWVSVGLKAGSQKDSTKALYATLARVHILPSALGPLGLGQVKPSDVQGFILALRESGKAESTVRQIYTVLRAIFESALADGLVARNVVAGVKRPSVTRRETHSLAPAEVAALLEQTDKTSYGLMIRLMAYTGLRRGEAVALRWEDVDLDSMTVNVRGTINRVAGVGLVTTLPKTIHRGHLRPHHR
jgi:integrase